MSINNVTVLYAARSKKGRSIIKFAVSGISIAISTLALFLLSKEGGLSLAMASTVAVELAAVGNYLLIESYLFAGRVATFRRFVKFNIASLLGLSLNVFAVWFLTRFGLYFLAANLVGIAGGFAVNNAFGVSYI
jgi:putative flippase GtrA